MKITSSMAWAALLALAGCGDSGPTDAQMGQALLMAISGGHPDKDDKPAPIKSGKCSKGDGDAWECDFLLDGSGRHGRFAKLGDSWSLIGPLR